VFGLHSNFVVSEVEIKKKKMKGLRRGGGKKKTSVKNAIWFINKLSLFRSCV